MLTNECNYLKKVRPSNSFHFHNVAFGPVYMDENCRQNTGTNPLCTRLHDDPAKSRVEMQGHFSYPLSTRTLGVKRRVFSNSPMMHCARDSFIQDGCCFGLLALDNRINNNPHKHLGRPKRIGYNCPGFEVYTSAHFQ
ncbi:hypothetical protein TNCV_4150231 [Trichonephila clavipes]|uniref:Uncharacterized protein n=1 Tax=Trichonephila clavipes TaxID=2585209 RepID=A0A8X7BFK7_TRICX|nr:hypothetical protein TNCV_4150231 [Trichonephila clavipes]